MPPTKWATSLTVVLLAGCLAPRPIPVAVPSPAVSDSPFLGCWSLSAPKIPGWLLASPGHVRFVDSTWARDSTPTYLILRVGSGIRSGGLPPFAWWHLTARDTAVLGWGDGLSGFHAEVGIEGDSLRGSTSAFTDGGGEGPIFPISGHRVACRPPVFEELGLTLEERLSLPPGSVSVDTLRSTGLGRPAGAMDPRPDLWVSLTWPAVERLSRRDAARLPRTAWKLVPADLSVHSLVLHFSMSDGIDGGGQAFSADSLDRIQARPR